MSEPSIGHNSVIAKDQLKTIVERIERVETEMKEQAEHDRSRDRMMQEHGIPILRFTGREIHRSPSKCASSVLTFVQKHVQRFTVT